MRGPKFDALVDEVLLALTERYGDTLLIHWEDFASQNSYRLLARARSKVRFQQKLQTALQPI